MEFVASQIALSPAKGANADGKVTVLSRLRG